MNTAGTRGGGYPERLNELVGCHDDHIHVLADQLLRRAGHLRALAYRAAHHEHVGLAFDVAVLAQPAPQGVQRGRWRIAAAAGWHAGHEEADPPDLSRRLRPRGRPPAEESARERHHEGPAIHDAALSRR
jgi:hypothetical protein